MRNVNYKKDANNNPILIGILGAVLVAFGGVAFFAGIASKDDSATMLMLIGALFLAIGAIMFVFAFIRGKAIKAYKDLLNNPSAYQTKATYIKKRLCSTNSTSVGVGRVDIPTSIHVFYKVYYSYTDEFGMNHDVKSTMSYTREQAEHLESLGTFAIKCKGEISAIVEELPSTKNLFNI